MEQSLKRFIRKSGLIAGAFNLVLNPAFAWLGNRDMADVPLYAAMLIDTAITCLAMSLLISHFVSADVDRAVRTGTIRPAAFCPHCPRWLSRLPARPWRFGLVLGGIVALTALPGLMLAFGILGVSSLSFASFALFKAIYTPPVAYVVTHWVILRQLSSAVT